MLLLDAPSITRAIQFCNIDPTVVERESARFASGILDPDDAGFLVARVLDYVEPVMVPVLTRALELRARQPDRAIVEAAGHRLHFTPAVGLCIRPGLEQVVTWIESGRPAPIRFCGEDEINGSCFERHPGRLVKTIRILLLLIGVRPNVRDKRPPALASRCPPRSISPRSLGSALIMSIAAGTCALRAPTARFRKQRCQEPFIDFCEGIV